MGCRRERCVREPVLAAVNPEYAAAMSDPRLARAGTLQLFHPVERVGRGGPGRRLPCDARDSPPRQFLPTRGRSSTARRLGKRPSRRHIGGRVTGRRRSLPRRLHSEAEPPQRPHPPGDPAREGGDFEARGAANELDAAYAEAKKNIPYDAFQQELTRRNITAADMREASGATCSRRRSSIGGDRVQYRRLGIRR